jgi:hypothetical protein
MTTVHFCLVLIDLRIPLVIHGLENCFALLRGTSLMGACLSVSSRIVYQLHLWLLDLDCHLGC